MNIMERIKKLYRKLILVLVLVSGTFMTSCEDYLTIIPPSVVVHEDFWHTEAEVRGMMATAYITLCNTDAISKAIVWGETRAETVDYIKGSQNDNIKFLLEGLLYDDNSFASWSTYYYAISCCNLVLEYGPEVTGNDPNFSSGEMVVAEGEMRALRAYAHFMLLRAFCNIPLATKVVMSDADIPSYPQVRPMEALNSIYKDLEIASTKVLKSSAPSSTSLGNVTTNAVYAMMADVDMWRAAFAKYYEIEGTAVATLTSDEYYDMAIANCQKVLDRMNEIHTEFFDKDEELKSAYNLIKNGGEDEMRKFGYSQVYNEIFGVQNSRESIFEFQIDDTNHAKGGNGIANIFGTEGRLNGQLVVAKKFMEKFKSDDLRKVAFTSFPDPDWTTPPTEVVEEYGVLKYIAKGTPVDGNGSREYRAGDNFDSHWIVYRKADVLLMQAEALVSRTTADETDIKTAFDITNAINRRWRADTTAITEPLTYTTEMTAKECLALVRDERALELCFEGKRWFDIVRMALQGEDTSFSYEDKNHGVDSEEMERRYNRISAYFMPIAKEELRFNPDLVQNESCKSSDNDDSISQN